MACRCFLGLCDESKTSCTSCSTVDRKSSGSTEYISVLQKSVVYNPGVGGAGAGRAGGLYPGQVPGGMMSNERHTKLN